MPEENDQMSSAKEEEVLADSVTEEAEGSVDAAKEEAEMTPEELKDKLERLTQERERLVEKVIRQSTARAEYKRELKAAKAQLKELTEHFGDLPSKEKPPEAVQTEEAASVPPSSGGERDLDKLVEEKLYEKEVIKTIKGRTQYREDAEVVKAYVDKMRKGGLSTGDAEQDVSQAMLLLQKRELSGGEMPSPTSSGVSGYGSESRERIPRSAIEMGRMFGHTEEDFKKYGDGEIKL